MSGLLIRGGLWFKGRDGVEQVDTREWRQYGERMRALGLREGNRYVTDYWLTSGLMWVRDIIQYLTSVINK